MSTVAELVLNITGKTDLDKAVRSANGELKDFTEGTKKADTASQDLAETLKHLDGDFDKMDETLGEISEKLKSDDALTTAADGFGGLEQVLTGVSDQLGVLEDQFGISLGPMNDWIQSGAQVAGGLEGIVKGGQEVYSTVKELGPVLQNTALAQKAAAAAQWLLNTAMAANPILLIIIALVAVGAAFYLFHDQIIDAIVGAWDTVKPVIFGIRDGILDAFHAVMDFFTNNWPTIVTLLSGPFFPIVALATDAFGVRSALTGAFQSVLDFVTGNWQTIASVIALPFAPIIFLATDAFGIRSKTIQGFQDVINFLITSWSTIWGLITWPFNQILGFAEDAFGVVSRVTGALANLLTWLATSWEGPVLTFFTNLPGHILSAIGDISHLLYNKGIDLIQGLVKGMLSVDIPNPLDLIPGGGAVKGAVGKATGFLHDDGLWEVPGPRHIDQYPALLSGGEMVLPAEAADRYRAGARGGAGGAGGGMSVNFNGPVHVHHNGRNADSRKVLADFAFATGNAMRRHGMLGAAA